MPYYQSEEAGQVGHLLATVVVGTSNPKQIKGNINFFRRQLYKK
ncbi:hypothetical protein DSUL_60187 [Desulfovibrionales bacterium]